MKLSDLNFTYPEALVATERAASSRVLFVRGEDAPVEIEGGVAGLLKHVRAGDLLVVNDTRVLPRRLFSNSGLEILFIDRDENGDWDVLCPASRWKAGEKQILPEGIELELVARGKPQKVRSSRALDERYFAAVGDLPLPPYIQKARGQRRNRGGDRGDYQTAWAEIPGSLAAPTASLHFKLADLDAFQASGGRVEKLTLHVGLGTFLPIAAANLDEHVMHSEAVEIPARTWAAVEETKHRGGRVWALGTTVTRALESAAAGKLAKLDDGGFYGKTCLFIRPGFEFRVIDVLCTNFHQPQSTLLALVAAYAGLDRVRTAYALAVERGFRLFSYGDLSVWTHR